MRRASSSVLSDGNQTFAFSFVILAAAWEPTLINLGHALRKLRRWAEALECYHRALGFVPGQPGTYTAVGYTYHLMGDLDKAIDNYHKVRRGSGKW